MLGDPALRLLLGDTKLTVTHHEDGSTVVTGELYPLGMLLPPAPSSPNPGRAQQKTPSPFETRCSELEGISKVVAGARNTQRWLTLELPMEVRIAC